MQMPAAPYHLNDLKPSFNALDWYVGQLLMQAAAVNSLQWDASKKLLVAEVSELDRPICHQVQVHLLFTPLGPTVKGTCTCSSATSCTHMAAAVQHWLSSAAPATQTPVDPSLLTLPNPLKAWLQESETLQEITHQVYFLLSYELQNTRLLQLKLTPTIALLDGTALTQIYPYPLEGRARIEVTVRPQDRWTLQALASLHDRNGLLDSTVTQVILQELLENNRLYLKSHLDRPLRPAPERHATLTWELHPDGSQHPGLQVQPTALWTGSHAPQYLDVENRAMGCIRTPSSEKDTHKFLQAPPIPAEHSETFLKHLQHSPHRHLPHPVALRCESRKGPPLPRLTLQLNPSPASPGKAIRTRQALLEFIYQGAVVPGNQLNQERQVHGTTVLSIQRDNMAENSHRQTLKNLKLGVEWDVQPLQQQRLVMQGESSERHFWAAFLKTSVPALRKAGWEIHIEQGFQDTPAGIEWYADVRPAAGHFTLDFGLLLDGQPLELLPMITQLLAVQDETLHNWLYNNDPAPYLLDVGLQQNIEMVALLKPILKVLLEYQQGKPGPVVLPPLESPVMLDLDCAVHPKWTGKENLWGKALKVQDLQLKWLNHPTYQQPAGLQGTLRPYQQDGVRWLQYLSQNQLGGILADDMGLGKTLQVLTHLLTEKEQGRLQKPALVVVPTSLLHTWNAEVQKFTPGLSTLTLHGMYRHKDFERIPQVDVVFTTYSLLGKDSAALGQHPYHTIVLDEAQNIKNQQTLTSKSLQQLDAEHRLCITGTPLENHLGELWSLFHFLMPGLLPGSRSFTQMYRTPIEKHHHSQLKDRLKHLLSPFILRRKKHDVARELPEKTEVVVQLDMEQPQRQLYDALRFAVHREVQAEVERQGLAKSHIHVLDGLMKLRQACCDPRLVNLEAAQGVKASVKLQWLTEMLPEMLEEGRSVLVFSQFTSMLKLLEETLQNLQVPYSLLTGETRNRQREIEQFQNGQVKVFLISLRAGGVGLNLTAADTVIHYDPWWNPAVENQATDRTHRIGQDKPIFVYKLITTGTLEDKILQLQARKAQLAHSILEDQVGDGWAFTWEDYQGLFQ